MEYTWHKITASIQELHFPENKLIEIEVAGKMVCISTHNETIRACAHKCPHAGGRLANGYLDALGNIVCPLHRYKFSLENGRNVSGEGYFLANYPIEKRKDGIYIGFKKNIFGK